MGQSGFAENPKSIKKKKKKKKKKDAPFGNKPSWKSGLVD